MGETNDSKHGVQSLEVGMRVLRAMVEGRRAMMLKDIAAAAGMPASKAHRYLVSLIRAGLVQQDPGTSRYDLGPFALHAGLVALDRLDRIRLGLDALAALRDRINETCALAIWSERGPVIVRWERPRRAITVNVVTGVQLNLLNSAAGQVFAAWLPRARVAPLLAEELRTLDLPPSLRRRADVDRLLEQIREEGVAALSAGYFAPGVEAAAAPVFNFKGDISMALVVVAVAGATDMGPRSAAIEALRAAAGQLSQRLGWRQPAASPEPEPSPSEPTPS